MDRYEWRYNQQAASCFLKSLTKSLNMLFCGGQTKGGVVGAQWDFLLVNKVVGNLVGWSIEKPFSHIPCRSIFFRMENIHVAKTMKWCWARDIATLSILYFPSRSIKENGLQESWLLKKNNRTLGTLQGMYCADNHLFIFLISWYFLYLMPYFGLLGFERSYYGYNFMNRLFIGLFQIIFSSSSQQTIASASARLRRLPVFPGLL